MSTVKKSKLDLFTPHSPQSSQQRKKGSSWPWFISCEIGHMSHFLEMPVSLCWLQRESLLRYKWLHCKCPELDGMNPLVWPNTLWKDLFSHLLPISAVHLTAAQVSLNICCRRANLFLHPGVANNTSSRWLQIRIVGLTVRHENQQIGSQNS